MTAAPNNFGPSIPEAADLAQATFRAVAHALAYPGDIVTMPPVATLGGPLTTAVAAICMAVLDRDVSVWLAPAFRGEAVDDFLRLRAGTNVTTDPKAADFAILAVSNLTSDMAAMRNGTVLQPEISTTLVVQVPSVTGGPLVEMTGPGIDGETQFAVVGLPDDFWPAWDLNAQAFPVGFDVLFVDGTNAVGLPRSARRTSPCC